MKTQSAGDAEERDQLSQNIEAIVEFYTREELKISRSQRFNVYDRHDAEAAALTAPMNPELVRAALDEGGGLAESAAPGASPTPERS